MSKWYGTFRTKSINKLLISNWLIACNLTSHIDKKRNFHDSHRMKIVFIIILGSCTKSFKCKRWLPKYPCTLDVDVNSFSDTDLERKSEVRVMMKCSRQWKMATKLPTTSLTTLFYRGHETSLEILKK